MRVFSKMLREKVPAKSLRLWMLLSITGCYAGVPAISPDEKYRCFRAVEWNYTRPVLHEHREFKSLSSVKPTISYENIQDAEMVFGTAYARSRDQYVDMFIPSYAYTKTLMEGVQQDAIQHLQEKDPRFNDQSQWKDVVGVYLMPGATFGMECLTPYDKVPLTIQNVLGSSGQQDAVPGRTLRTFLRERAHPPKNCVVLTDVIDTLQTEFQAIAQLVDVLVPQMTAKQARDFQILIIAAIVKNRLDEEVTVCIKKKTYCLGVLCAHRTVMQRLTTYAKVHLLEEFLEKEGFMAGFSYMSEAKKIKTLQEFVKKSPKLHQWADIRYIRYVDPTVIYKVKADDFVQAGWIDAQSADRLCVSLPQTSVSHHRGRNLQPPLQKFCQKHKITHCLEPMLFFPEERIIWHTPADHAKVSEEITGDARAHAAHILTLHSAQDNHYKAAGHWLDHCPGKSAWVKGETLGVILLDRTRDVPLSVHSQHLLQDVQLTITKDLRAAGYQARFIYMTASGYMYEGHCDEGQARVWHGRAEGKSPVCYKLVDFTVRVCRHAQFFSQTLGSSGIRTM